MEKNAFLNEFGFLPRELIFKCDVFIRAYHDKNGSGWSFVKPQVLMSRHSPYLRQIERASIFQFRCFQVGSLLGLLAICGAFFWSYWLLLGAIGLAIFSITMMRNAKFNLVQIRALILANEMLAKNFAGWAESDPIAAKAATIWLENREPGDESLIDTYLPASRAEKFAESFKPSKV